jgi:hypothetical protein
LKDKAHSGEVSKEPAMVKKGANCSNRELILRIADNTVAGIKQKKECRCVVAEITRY